MHSDWLVQIESVMEPVYGGRIFSVFASYLVYSVCKEFAGVIIGAALSFKKAFLTIKARFSQVTGPIVNRPDPCRYSGFAFAKR